MNLRLATLQRLAVLAFIGLALGYLAVLRPVIRRVVEEDQPLRALRGQLAQATVEAGLPPNTPFLALSNRLDSLRQASLDFDAAVREALPRFEQPPEIRSRMDEPFLLVEFLNESQRRVEELTAQAKAAKVTLTPGLPRGFPRYLPEVVRPELLWVQLALMNRVVRTAIRAGVREVKEVSVEPLPLQESIEPVITAYGTVPPPAPATNRWVVLRLHLTALGTAETLGSLLLGLALTPEELKPTGLPVELAGRPALFIDHLLMRRDQLESAEQAQLEVVVSTVVPDEER